MSFLKNIRRTEQLPSSKTWSVLRDLDQLSKIETESFENPVVIFKHSIRCGTSAMVKDMLQKEWDLSENNVAVYYLDLINHRMVSNKIAEQFEVVHQSPQVLIISQGKCIWNQSHFSIQYATIKAIVLEQLSTS